METKTLTILISIIAVSVFIILAYIIFQLDKAQFPIASPESKTLQKSSLNEDATKVKMEDSPIASYTTTVLPASVTINNVPFTAQAPFGDWDDVRQDYGCEEASLLMAMHWVNDTPIDLDKAKNEIIAISEFELKNYGHHHDSSIEDTQIVLREYFNFNNSVIQQNIGLLDIKKEIAQNNLVIIPINGQKVTNPFYSDPGPVQHQILVVGYDDKSLELIVHDPGTTKGEYFRYSYQEIESALMDYKTGYNEPIEEIVTAMLIIKK